MIKYLELATATNDRIVICAEGEAAVFILTRLSTLMGLPLTDSTTASPRLTLYSPDARPSELNESPAATYAGYDIYPQSGHLRLCLVPNHLEVLELARVRFPLMAVLMQAVMDNIPCILFHGSMLEDSDGHATLLVASSGVGKSTSARRFAEAGGVAHFDDQMLLCRRQEGDSVRFYVHGLPTWSRVFEKGYEGNVFPFQPPRPVKNIYCLTRSAEREEIRPLPLPMWHGHLVAAMLEHLIWPEAILDTDGKLRLASICWKFVESLDQVFLPMELAAHLDFNLKETLATAPAQLKNA